MDDEEFKIPVKDKTVNAIEENTLEAETAENKNQDSPSTTKDTHETQTEATTKNTVGTDLTNSDTGIETINTPVDGSDTNPATEELVETNVSETTPMADSPLVATSTTFETDHDTKEDYTEDTIAPTTTTEMNESPSEETSNVAKTGEHSDTHTIIEETEESASSSVSQQEDTTTTTALETAKTQESLPQEEYKAEAAAATAAPLSHEEGDAHHTNMEAEGSPHSQQEDDTTITTAAETHEMPPQGENIYENDTTITTADETRESPPQGENIYEATVEVSSETGHHSSQQDQDSTSPSQTEDDNNITRATEAGGTPEVEQFEVEETVGDNRRSSTKQQNRRRRYLKIAIGVVLVIIIGLGIGTGLLWLSIDNKGLTTTETTTISTTTETTTVEPTTTTVTSTTTEIEATTTKKIKTTTTAAPSFISKKEMRLFTSGLIDLDDNNKGNKVTVKHQDKIEEGWTNQTWNQPLLKFKNGALDGPTLKKFVALLNNYEVDVDTEETTTDEEITEQKEFLDAVMKTKIMKQTEEFMRNKTFDMDLRDYLQQIWFTPYSRSSNVFNETSGFEHTFVGETDLKEGKIRGFQSWVNFGLEEENKNLKYKGWVKSMAIKKFTIIPNPIAKKKGEIINLTFEWHNITRSLDFMFIGTSPELEMALYTLCFWAKRAKKCHVQLNNHRFVIHTSDYGSHEVVGSSYPDISRTII